MKKEILIFLLLFLISFPAVRALLLPGGFTSHDLTHHVIRQISMDKLLSEGQFPPRWSGELNNGYGYPVFLFNYPLPAMVGQTFHWMGLGYVDSVKAVLFSSMMLSVMGMYLFLRSLLGSKLAAFLGAIFYLYAPIRFLNVYVSAAVGSALALGILPFVFWSLVLISKRDRGNMGNWGILGGGIFLALLILAHNVTALIFASVIVVFAWILVRDLRDVRVVRDLGIMFLLGLGLSAWFWLPAVLEKEYTNFDLIFGSFYKDQFINLWQLLRSPWGYGLSHPASPEPGDMSYQLGLAHILVILVLVALWWAKRGIREIRTCSHFGMEDCTLCSQNLAFCQGQNVRVIGGFVLFFFVLSVFLMLKISLPLWERLPFLSLIQFPLRFQAISIFSASIAAALLIKNLPYRSFLFLILLILVIYANRNHWNINEKFDPGEEYYLNSKTTSTSYGEHLPKWGKVMKKMSPAKLELIGGIGEIRVIRDQSANILAEVEAANAAKLRLNQFYFPGWQIQVDGKPVHFNYLTEGESYGLPVFDTEKGKHLVKAEFKNTLVRNLADFITVIIVIIVICKPLLQNLSKIRRSS